MPQEMFPLAGNATEIYEDQKVPAVFGPLAEATLDLVSLSPDDAILDVACGTGIMARKIRQRVGSAARIAASIWTTPIPDPAKGHRFNAIGWLAHLE